MTQVYQSSLAGTAFVGQKMGLDVDGVGQHRSLASSSAGEPRSGAPAKRSAPFGVLRRARKSRSHTRRVWVAAFIALLAAIRALRSAFCSSVIAARRTRRRAAGAAA